MNQLKKLLEFSTNEALKFARRLVFNHIPRKVLYDIAIKNGVRMLASGVNIESAVEILWRNGSVPRWADIQVKCIQDGATIVSLMISDEYVANFEETLYSERGTGPFGVKSPDVPWPICLLSEKKMYRFVIGKGCWQRFVNNLLFRWWSLLGCCDRASMRFYKDNNRRAKKLFSNYV